MSKDRARQLILGPKKRILGPMPKSSSKIPSKLVSFNRAPRREKATAYRMNELVKKLVASMDQAAAAKAKRRARAAGRDD
ncbi:MAG TPA: hypothetical protein VFV50_00790 [Bdellovibrionales bacterium]|nr:hypothetical protein [Bdellovibrionales bacterium]